MYAIKGGYNMDKELQEKLQKLMVDFTRDIIDLQSEVMQAKRTLETLKKDIETLDFEKAKQTLAEFTKVILQVKTL
jgi:hypothetical protein